LSTDVSEVRAASINIALMLVAARTSETSAMIALMTEAARTSETSAKIALMTGSTHL
jgi:hypothetical protein